MQYPQWCLKQAEKIGPCCHQLIERLFADKVLHNLRAAQGIVLGLKEKYSVDRLEAACKRALLYDNPRYHTVKNVLKKGLDKLDEPISNSQPLSNVYIGYGKFCRDPNSLLI